MRGSQDLAAGAAVVAFAVAALVALARIPTTKFQSISPDLFPRVCAYLLVACGIALLLRGWRKRGASLERVPWRGVLLVLAAVVAFALVAPRFGYAPAGFLAAFVAGLASREAKPLRLAGFAAALTAFSVLLFSVALKVPMQAFKASAFGL